MERQLELAPPAARRRRAPDRMEAGARDRGRDGEARHRPRRSSASSPTAGCASAAARSRSAPGTTPTAEPEVAVHVASDVPADGDRDAVAAASAASASRSSWSTSATSSSRRSSRATSSTAHVILGRRERGRRLGALRGQLRHGDETDRVDDPWALVGDPVDALAHLATHLAAFGETVRAGDVLITGSIVPAPSGRARRPAGLPARPARRRSRSRSSSSGGPGLRGYTPRALAPMAELVDAPG